MADKYYTLEYADNGGSIKSRRYVFPDSIPAETAQFATVIPYRTPEFKVHKSEGLANSALANRNQGAKYKLENGAWVKVWEYKEPTHCDNCEQQEPPDAGYRWFSTPRDYRGPAIEAPNWCPPCIQEAADARRRIEQERKDRAELARLQEKYN